MTSLDLAPSARAIPPEPKRKRVSAKVQAACKLIVWEGQELDEAAKAAGLTTRALRLAIEHKHVLAFLKAEREVFRQYISAQNIHHAVKVRSGSNQMAVINALKYIDNQDDERTAGRSNAPQVPGLVVQIINNGPSAPQVRTIEQPAAAIEAADE